MFIKKNIFLYCAKIKIEQYIFIKHVLQIMSTGSFNLTDSTSLTEYQDSKINELTANSIKPPGFNIKDPSKISCIAIGDPHFKASNVPEATVMVDRICQKIKDLDPTFVVCLGDILHTHEKIHVEPLCLATSFLLRMAQLKPTYLIIGNHDRPNNSDFLTNKHAFNGLKDHPNMYIIDTTKEYKIGDYRFVFVPYVYPGRFMEALNKIENPLTETKCIFAHQEFLGAKMGAIESTVGDPWPIINPLVVSGHIHDYDDLQTNMIYTGTPMQHAFGDRDDKTISLFEFIPIQKEEDKGWKQTRLELNLIKRKIVRMKCSELNNDWQPPKNCLVKLILYGSDAELKTIMKHPKVKELQKVGISIAYKENSNSLTSPLKNPKPYQNYLTTLYQEISTDSNLIQMYQEIFGSSNHS